jgi:hypothetical protein
MSSQFDDNKKFLRALFGGDFPGHAILFDLPGRDGLLGDFAINNEPLACRVSHIEKDYENAVRFHEALGDDSVPFASVHTNTGLLATPFGCPIVLFEGSNPAARPVVRTASEADALPEPDLWSSPLGKHLQLVAAVRERLGDDAPISGPDMQSALGVAATVWDKEEFLAAMIETPEAVHNLIRKCHNLIKSYLTELHRISPSLTPIHHPRIWAPKEFGASFSEDEVGAISRAMYEEFGLWSLIDFSESFGGLNRNYQAKGPEPCLRAFGDRTVHMEAADVSGCRYFLGFGVPDVRFTFSFPQQPLEDAKRTLEEARKVCPRV